MISRNPALVSQLENSQNIETQRLDKIVVGKIARPNRNKKGAESFFDDNHFLMSEAESDAIVQQALAKWQPSTKEEAEKINKQLVEEFPDRYAPADFWDAPTEDYLDFFVWGHNHDFGHGVVRQGAMSTRHIEITSRAIRLGYLPTDLSGKRVLNIGCWTGGDSLVLAGLGAYVVSFEEHKIAAAAGARLMELLKVPGNFEARSIFADDEAYRQSFDYIYCSGVIYHVTDPMLLMRICFCYLKNGGGCFIETKSVAENGDQSLCSYSGILERGWNWYGPNKKALGRWFVDSGYDMDTVKVFRRENDRLLAFGEKKSARRLPENAGFSRPGSWLEGEH